MKLNDINILIADNNTEAVNEIKRLLISEGITEISYVDKGQKVLPLIRLTKYDIFIIDTSLPDIQAVEILQDIKHKYEDAEVIIISAEENIDRCKEAFKFGASSFFTKPFDTEQLVSKIKRIANEIIKKETSQESVIPEEINECINIIKNKNTDDIEKDRALLKIREKKDPLTIPFLLELLDSSNISLKEKAVFALGDIGTAEVCKPLVNILYDSKEALDIRMAAIMALHSLGEHDVTRPFINLIQQKISGIKKKKKPF